MSIEILGRAYPPSSSLERDAALLIDGETARIRIDGEPERRFATHDLKIEAPIGDAARQLYLPGGDLFWTEDRDAVQEIERRLRLRRLAPWEAVSPRLIILPPLALFGAWLIWRYALPAVIRVAVAMTPEPLRDAIDSGTVQALDRITAETSALDRDAQETVRSIFANLVDHSDHDPEDFDLLFRHMPGLGPNAIALPGGTIIITDELVTDFPDPSVIAGVLAHEIGHVDEDHGLRQVYRSLGLFVLISLIAGDTGPLLEDALLEGGLLLSLTYSRAFEREADLYGLRLAEAAGYDPAGLLDFFQSLPDADETEAGWSSTHPASGERIDVIREWLSER